MFDVLFIGHDKLTPVLLDEIIKVKSVAWPFNYDEQCKWISDNLKNSDIHVLLFDDKKVIAYLNLIEIEVKVDEVLCPAYGIGNVCALEKGKGWGKELITQVNKYLLENNKVGLLFCKDKLLNFYSENEWTILEDNKISLLNMNNQGYSLAFNCSKTLKVLEYIGKSF